MSNRSNCRCGGYGALRSLNRSDCMSGCCTGCGNCNGGNCPGTESRNCGCNSRQNCNRRTACAGCCNACDNGSGCFAAADCPECTACSGSRLFFTGRCGAKNGECGCTGVCARSQNCGCSACNACNSCGNECDCDGCCEACSSAAVAAEFVAMAPESEIAGGTLTFQFESGNEDAFAIRPDGIRMCYPGRYIAFYNFIAPAGDNVSTILSLALNGADLFASRTFAEPAVQTSATTASGQAMFDANPGDRLALNTSAAIEIPRSVGDGPIATLIIYRIE